MHWSCCWDLRARQAELSANWLEWASNGNRVPVGSMPGQVCQDVGAGVKDMEQSKCSFDSAASAHRALVSQNKESVRHFS